MTNWRRFVLAALNLLQLILYIPLLALAGQGVLYVLAGPKRDSNFFYRLLQLLSKPFTLVVRKLTPKMVADVHVPIVTFFLVLILYFIVTFERIDLCMRVGLEHCR
jgi:cytochrome b561